MKPADRVRSIEASVHLLRLHSRSQKLPRHAEAPGARIAEAEPTGVGEKCDIQADGDLRRDLGAERDCDIIDELAGGTGGRVGKDLVGRWLITRNVMID